MEILNHSQPTNVYALVDPRNNNIRYIGVTKNLLHSRLNDHIREARNNPQSGNKHKNYWIKQLLNLDIKPRIILLEKCNDAYDGEIWWISLFNALSFPPLVNIAKGGDNPPSWQGKKHTVKTKRKQSNSITNYYKNNVHPSKGTTQTQEHKDRIQQSRKRNGTKSNPEIMLKKRVNNPDWYLNLSKAQKERFSNPANNPMYGKQHTELSKKKNSLAQRMRNAYLRDDYLLVCELQEDWLELTGKYKPDYMEFVYV